MQTEERKDPMTLLQQCSLSRQPSGVAATAWVMQELAQRHAVQSAPQLVFPEQGSLTDSPWWPTTSPDSPWMPSPGASPLSIRTPRPSASGTMPVSPNNVDKLLEALQPSSRTASFSWDMPPGHELLFCPWRESPPSSPVPPKYQPPQWELLPTLPPEHQAQSPPSAFLNNRLAQSLAQPMHQAQVNQSTPWDVPAQPLACSAAPRLKLRHSNSMLQHPRLTELGCEPQFNSASVGGSADSGAAALLNMSATNGSLGTSGSGSFDLGIGLARRGLRTVTNRQPPAVSPFAHQLLEKASFEGSYMSGIMTQNSFGCAPTLSHMLSQSHADLSAFFTDVSHEDQIRPPK